MFSKIPTNVHAHSNKYVFTFQQMHMYIPTNVHTFQQRCAHFSMEPELCVYVPIEPVGQLKLIYVHTRTSNSHMIHMN